MASASAPPGVVPDRRLSAIQQLP